VCQGEGTRQIGWGTNQGSSGLNLEASGVDSSLVPAALERPITDFSSAPDHRTGDQTIATQILASMPYLDKLNSMNSLDF
jgi:hypothetical protein